MKAKDKKVAVVVTMFVVLVMLALRWEWNMLHKQKAESKEEVKAPTPRPPPSDKTPWGYKLQGTDEFWATINIDCKGDEKFSMADIERRSTENDLLLLMRGYVFDVTKFRTAHPGGDAILGGAKQDCSEIFETHHQSFVGNMLSNFCVGKLIP
eukprot:TRINITY_DN2066_c1_g2_i1.p1 TRINITY_DN2066_c1_g2~~TRINITY_DN2066_c1_g2_i1.p1  ORF type:complete len:163 (+),score=39.73 TRINITY_DN2066_c1_g2_i1:32-490(+)